MGSDAPVDGIRVRSIGDTNLDIGVFEPETRVDVGGDLVVGFYNVFYVDTNEVIERIDVLLY